MVQNREEAQHLLDSVPVKYVVLDNTGYPGISERYAAQVIARSPFVWKRVYSAEGGMAHVYERR
jgi:hypothetical protein